MFNKLLATFRKGRKNKNRHEHLAGDVGHRRNSIAECNRYDEVGSNQSMGSDYVIRKKGRRFSSLRGVGEGYRLSNSDLGYISDSVLPGMGRKRQVLPVTWGESPVKRISGYDSCDKVGSTHQTAGWGTPADSTQPQYCTIAQPDPTVSSANIQKEPPSTPTSLDMIICNDFEPCCKGELSCQQGQHVKALFRHNDWLFVRARNGAEGYVPLSYCMRDKRYNPRQSHNTNTVQSDGSRLTYNRSKSQLCSQPKQGRLPPRSFSQGQMMGSNDPPPAFTKSRGSWAPSGYTPHRGGTVHSGNQSDNSTDCHTQPMLRARSAASDSELTRSVALQRAFQPQLQNQTKLAEGQPKAVGARCIAMYDFVRTRPTEITLLRGETAYITNAENDHWLWVACSDGRRGYIPRSFVTLQEDSPGEPLKGSNLPSRYSSDTELAGIKGRQQRQSAGSVFNAPGQPAALRLSTSNVGLSRNRSPSFRTATQNGPHWKSSLPTSLSDKHTERPVDVPAKWLAERMEQQQKNQENDTASGTAMDSGVRARSNSTAYLRRMSPVHGAGKRKVGSSLENLGRSTNSSSVLVLWSFEAQRSTQLSVARGEIVTADECGSLSSITDWMKVANRKGQTGCIPAACVKPAPRL